MIEGKEAVFISVRVFEDPGLKSSGVWRERVCDRHLRCLSQTSDG